MACGWRCEGGAGWRWRRVDARVKLACLAAYVIVALHARTPLALALCMAAALVLAAAARMRPYEVVRVLRPLAPILIFTVVAQVLSVQQGDVLARLGPVALTREALAESARMVLSLLCIMVASVAFMRCTTTEELVRALRWMLVPLRRAGLRVDAFMVALSVAFRFVPVLVGEFHQLKQAQVARGAGFDGGVRTRLAAHMRLFGPLLRSSYRRADTLAEAFVARCLSCGAEPTTLHESRIGASDIAFAAGVALVCIAVCIV